MSQFLGKGLGLLAMLATGPGGLIGGAKGLGTLAQVLSGAGVAGGVSKYGAEGAVKRAGLGFDPGPDVLYGLEEKEEAESYAHSAVDTLLSSIDPGAISSAVTTPLTYLTMKNLQADPSLLTGKPGANYVEGRIRARPLQGEAPSFWDWFSQQGWTQPKHQLERSRRLYGG